MTKMDDDPMQMGRVREAAYKLGADEDEATFLAKLRVIAKHMPPAKQQARLRKKAKRSGSCL